MAHLQFRANRNVGWQAGILGPGGWLVGGDIASDGTRVARTDSYGAYCWTGTTWRQLVTSTSMPVGDFGHDYGEGVYELRIAPSNTQIFYMIWRGRLYRTTDRGVTWARCSGFTRGSFVEGGGVYEANSSTRMFGERIAVNPSDANRVLVGKPGTGLLLTTDGGSNFSTIGTISNVAAPGYSIIWIDATTALCSIHGVGVYKSTDSGATFSSTSGPTTIFCHWQLSNGIVYGVENSATRKLWKYASSTWTDLGDNFSGESHCVAVDPADATKLYLFANSSAMLYSSDSGASWTTPNWYEEFILNMSRVATDIPWLAATREYYKSCGNAFIDPITNKLSLFEGIGFWYATRQTNPAVNVEWNSQNVGIEQLVSNIIVSPPGASSKPLVGVWDRGTFLLDQLPRYPTGHGPDYLQAITNTHGLDYASSDPNFIVAINTPNNKSAYSTTGGAPGTWTLFSSVPPDGYGGCIAASTPDNMVWVGGNGGLPYYTVDGGDTWTRCTIPGEDVDGYVWSYFLKRICVAADRVTANKFYLYNYVSGLYVTTDGGVNWTNIGAASVMGAGGDENGNNGKLKAVPGHAGMLLWCTGWVGSDIETDTHPSSTSHFRISTDAGANWSSIPNVKEVHDFGFGKASGGYDPTVFIYGYVDSEIGVWCSEDIDQATPTWTKIGDYPLNSVDMLVTVSGDMNVYGRCYVGWSGSSIAYYTP